MGAKIEGIGSNLLTIEGVESLEGTTHRLLPDMIEIGSWIGLAAITKSELRLKNVAWEQLGQLPRVYAKLGITLIKEGDDMIIPAHKDGYEIQSFIDGSHMTISDAPWPGLSPDVLSVLLLVATQAKGSVLIHQKMFESRVFFVYKKIEIGAQLIVWGPHRAKVFWVVFNL
jgi:UDP-N-acetylglucosamine 1-carboxyvinyltransferase